MAKVDQEQINRAVNKRLTELFGKSKGEKSGEILYREAENSMYMTISPEARKCQDISDKTKRGKCLDKVVMKSIVILINEIDRRIDRCGTDKGCIDYLLQKIISLARYSREKFGQNLDDMANRIVQRYGYSGIKWAAIGTSFKLPSFAKNMLVEV